jgi:hypothetical protein
MLNHSLFVVCNFVGTETSCCVCCTARCGTPDSVPTSTSSTRGHILLATGRSGVPTHRESSPESLKLTWNFFARSRFFIGARIRPPDPFDALGDGATRAMAAAPAAACAEECQASASQAQGDGRGDPDADGLYCAARRHSLSRPGWFAPHSIDGYRPSSLSCTRIPPPASPAACAELSERAAHPSCRRVRVHLPLKAADSCGALGCETDDSLCGPVLR